MRRVERGGRLMVSVTPSGFPVRDGSGLQGFRCRSTACLWSSTPTGFTRPDERMNANSTRGQTPLRRENECQLNERANVNPRKP